MIRVLLADDHTLVRQGLRRILETDPEIEVVGEAGDGRSAVDMACSVQPDVILMDIAMPQLNGIEATRQVTQHNEGARVLVLSMHADDVYVRQSLKAGARGYLLKDSEDLELLKAVKAVNCGGSFFSPAISKLLLEGYLDDSGTRAVEDKLELLTNREREILQLIAEGQTNRDIATQLGLGINTVETHRKHIMEKLDVHNTAEVVRFAVRKKIVR